MLVDALCPYKVYIRLGADVDNPTEVTGDEYVDSLIDTAMREVEAMACNTYQKCCWSDQFEATVRARPGCLSTLAFLSVFLCKSVLYSVFVWARRALNS
jgi:hypothetical protein